MIDSRILEVVREHLKVCLTINCDSAELNRTKVEFTVGLYIDEIMISESSDFIMVSN